MLLLGFLHFDIHEGSLAWVLDGVWVAMLGRHVGLQCVRLLEVVLISMVSPWGRNSPQGHGGVAKVVIQLTLTLVCHRDKTQHTGGFKAHAFLLDGATILTSFGFEMTLQLTLRLVRVQWGSKHRAPVKAKCAFCI